MELDVKCAVPIEYTAAGASVPVVHSLYLVVVSDSTAVVHPGLSSNGVCTIEYSDL